MGLKLDNTEESRLDYLIKGWTITSLKILGTTPEEDLFIIINILIFTFYIFCKLTVPTVHQSMLSCAVQSHDSV